MEIRVHTTQPLVPEPNPFDNEIAIEKLKRYKTPDIYQIPAELIQTGGLILRSGIHTLINSTWNKEEFPERWTESVNVPVLKKGDKSDRNSYRGILLLLTL
jgi:hypothetical protein